MANSTYLELTNELLRRLLETELTSTEFPSARSTQATAKDCIRASISEISAKEREWPFNYTTGTETLVIGTIEYDFPTDYKMVDWESFYIEKSDALGTLTTPLKQTSRDSWLQNYRVNDLNAGSDGVDIPMYVFDSSVGRVKSFGVTPSPDKAYVLKYEYYAKDTELSLYDDETNIPKEFNYVILNGALKHFYMFKDNTEQANIWTNEFDKSLNQMRHILIPKKDDMVDTRVNYGGMNWR